MLNAKARAPRSALFYCLTARPAYGRVGSIAGTYRLRSTKPLSCQLGPFVVGTSDSTL